ncbi:MAG: serine hydrolase [Chitinivibrionia bacterium]|nr:serine hydrolase [Chitinivibrionia bacterium]
MKSRAFSMNRRAARTAAFPAILACMAAMLVMASGASGNAAEPAKDSAVYSRLEPDVFMTRWLALGPVPVFAVKPDSANEDAEKKVFEAEQLEPRLFGSLRAGSKRTIGRAKYQWSVLESESDFVDFTPVFGDSEFAVAYAWAEMHSPDARTMLAGFGSDDGIKVWLNGELVHTNWITRPVNEDADLVPLALKKGKNELLIKIQNRQDGWGFACRIMGPELFPKKLVSAAKQGAMDELTLLLENGADVNAATGSGMTAYHAAKMYGRTDTAKLLVRCGADTTIAMPSKDALVASLFEPLGDGASPGAAVLVSRNGSIVYEKGFGYADIGNKVPATPDTKFRIGSVTKQFTAASILKLQEDGLLSVNDPLSKYFPDFPRGDEVRLHHLLTHTSGIHSYTDQPDFLDEVQLEIDSDDVVELIQGFEYDFNPGEKWQYCNSGYFLLGRIVEMVSDEPYGDFLEDTFFDGLEMDNTGVHYWPAILANEAMGYSYSGGTYLKAKDWDMTWAGGAGALYSTVGDLFRWNEGLFDGGEMLSEKSLKTALTPVALNDGTAAPAAGGGYGYGWMIGDVRGVKQIAHGGGLHGFVSHLAWYPEQRMSVVVLMNCAPSKEIGPGQAAADIAQIYLWEEMKPEGSHAVDTTVDPGIYDDYIGRYEYPMGAVMTITRDGDRLFAQLSGQQQFEIYPESKDKFFWKVVEAGITFVRGENGAVAHAVHSQGGQEFSAPRMKDEKQAAIDLSVLGAYPGDYKMSESMTLAVTQENGRLFVQATGQPKLEVFPRSENEFFYKVVKADITFIKDESGAVTELILNQGGRKFKAPKIK